MCLAANGSNGPSPRANTPESRRPAGAAGRGRRQRRPCDGRANQGVAKILGDELAILGLIGLADGVEALGGRIKITNHKGTVRLLVTLPIEDR
jgi:hypothetical protein